MSAVTDPVADMLTRIRNGIRARHARVEMPSSNLKVEIAHILKDEGYIGNYKLAEEGKKKTLRISLRYATEGVSAISVLERVSKPGRRVYARKDRLPRVLGGMGVAILSTSSGLVTSRTAQERGIGGEVVCFIW